MDTTHVIEAGSPTDSASSDGVEEGHAPTGRFRVTPERLALVAVAGLAGLSYAWGIKHAALEPFYAAGVRSMALNWHNFFYGAFDPAGTITLDKLPGAFWVQALSVRIFGYHTWAIVLPQVVEGVLSVLFLYRAVARLRGTSAALVAAIILAASPAVVALDRGNIADTAMTLLLILAANAVSAAIVSGRQRHLVWAGLWIGLAFQAKMLEAWLVLPAFGLAYVVGSRDRWVHRLGQVAVGGLVALVVSLSWMTIVTLTPANQRPYVDGSQTNSAYEQVFVYNGFGRTGQQPGFEQFVGGIHLNPAILDGPAPGWNRLLHGDMGRDTGWLLPAAVVLGIGGLFTRHRRYFILWVGWLVPMAAVFSKVFIFHSYYTAALAPPMAAILGAGTASLWESRTEGRVRFLRGCAAAIAVVAGTLAYSAWLLHGSGAHSPAWLWPLALGSGAVAVVLLALSATFPTQRGLLAAGVLVGAAAMLVIPATGSASVVAEGRGFGDSPFESPQTAAMLGALLSTSNNLGSVLPGLERLQMGSPYVMAVYTSAVAAGFISASGKEILPIGGFTGAIPEPTIGQLATMIRQGRFHLVLMTGGHDPRLAWIADHCHHVGPGGTAVGLFICEPSDVTGSS